MQGWCLERVRSYRITLSNQAGAILEALLSVGIYGGSVPEIIQRFVEARLADYVLRVLLKLKRRKANGAKPKQSKPAAAKLP